MTWLRTVWLLRHSLWLHSHGSTRIARAELETMSVNKLRWFWKKNFARKMRELVDEFKEELSDGMKFKVIVAVRVLRKKHHVMRMRSFFRHFGGKPTVSLIARVFRGKIITCQQLARQFLACKRARIRSIGRVAYEIEERVREVEDFEPHRDSAEQHMHALEQDYHKTHDRVLTMMGSVTDAEAHSATVTASRQAIIHEHLAKWRKAHVAKHTDAYNEAIAVYNGKTGRELTVDEMRRLVHKSAAAMTNFVFGNADDEENEKPVWPTLILYSKLRHDEQFKHDVEAWVRRYPDGR